MATQESSMKFSSGSGFENSTGDRTHSASSGSVGVVGAAVVVRVAVVVVGVAAVV